jgi:hypothetical protein
MKEPKVKEVGDMLYTTLMRTMVSRPLPGRRIMIL